jgi:hypothetical protein
VEKQGLNMRASRGMGDIAASKMPKGKKKARRDDTDFTQFAKGGKVGLYENIHKKQARIAAGSGEKMRPVGSKGAPTKADFIKSAKTAKKK